MVGKNRDIRRRYSSAISLSTLELTRSGRGSKPGHRAKKQVLQLTRVPVSFYKLYQKLTPPPKKKKPFRTNIFQL